MYKKFTVLSICILFIITTLCFAGTNEKIVFPNKPKNRAPYKQKIVLFDETAHELLLIDVNPLLENNPYITDDDSVLFCNITEKQYFFDLCPETGKIAPYLFSPLTPDRDYDFHRAIENHRIELTKFILKFYKPTLNFKIGDKTPLERAIDGLNPDIVSLLLSNHDIIVDENHLKLAKEKLEKISQMHREHQKVRHIYGVKFNETMLREGLVNSDWKEIYKIFLDQRQKAKQIVQMIADHLGLNTQYLHISK